MSHLPLFEPAKDITTHFEPSADIVLYHGDASEFIHTIPDNSVELIVTSPPYNLGKVYESRIPIEEYLETQAQTIAE